MNIKLFENMQISIFQQNYQVSKNGIIILTKVNTSFARAIQKKEEILYAVQPYRYSDYELFRGIISNNRNARVIQWAVLLIFDENKQNFTLKKASVTAENEGLRIRFDNSDDCDIKEFVRQMEQADIRFKEICIEYMRQNNYLLDIKKLLMPYDMETVSKIQKSILLNCVESYKKAAREVYYYRSAALNEYAKLLAQAGKEKEVTILSLNAYLSMIKDSCVDLKHKMYNGFKDCMDSYLEEFEKNLQGLQDSFYKSFVENEVIRKYMIAFLEQNFYNQLNARIRVKPDTNLYEIHMGKNWENGKQNIRSLYISPRYRAGRWENDNSEIRRVNFEYYTIGHLLSTGLVIGECNQVKHYARFSDSLCDLYSEEELEEDEKAFVKCYLDYVASQKETMQNIPLLIPQFRFAGKETKHIYRGDFLILNYLDRNNVRKILIELSRNYLHNKQGEEDAVRRNDFIRKYNCLTIEIRDFELENLEQTFMERIVLPGYLQK